MTGDEVVVTNADYVPERDGIVARLKKLLTTPPLKVSASGGGIPEEQILAFEYVVLIERAEVEHVITLLELKAEAS